MFPIILSYYYYSLYRKSLNGVVNNNMKHPIILHPIILSYYYLPSNRKSLKKVGKNILAESLILVKKE